MNTQSQASFENVAITHIKIGTMIKNEPGDIWAPSQYCLQEEGKLYQGFDWRLGDTNLVFPESFDPGKFGVDPVVMVKGHYEADLTRHIKKIGKCDPDTFVQHIQMRSDWGNPESGSLQGLTTRARLTELAWFQVASIEAPQFIQYHAIYADSTPEALEITFTNVFEENLPEIPFALHYEGGRKKPMPVYVDETIPALAPNESHTHRLPVVISRGDSIISKYAFSSLILKQEINTTKTPLSFVLDLPFYKLGLSEGYPSHKKLNR